MIEANLGFDPWVRPASRLLVVGVVVLVVGGFGGSAFFFEKRTKKRLLVGGGRAEGRSGPGQVRGRRGGIHSQHNKLTVPAMRGIFACRVNPAPGRRAGRGRLVRLAGGGGAGRCGRGCGGAGGSADGALSRHGRAAAFPSGCSAQCAAPAGERGSRLRQPRVRELTKPRCRWSRRITPSRRMSSSRGRKDSAWARSCTPPPGRALTISIVWRGRGAAGPSSAREPGAIAEHVPSAPAAIARAGQGGEEVLLLVRRGGEGGRAGGDPDLGDRRVKSSLGRLNGDGGMVPSIPAPACAPGWGWLCRPAGAVPDMASSGDGPPRRRCVPGRKPDTHELSFFAPFVSGTEAPRHHFAAAITAAAWPSTFTLRQIFTIVPWASIRKVARSTPIEVRP